MARVRFLDQVPIGFYDVNNGSGGGGGGGSTPGGSFGSIQYNDGGTLNGDSDLLWDKNTNTVLLNGSLNNGTGNQTSGLYSHAEGVSSIASGVGSHAEGQNTEAIGNSSHAEGGGTTSSGSYSHAEGSETISSGSYSHAEGASTRAIGAASHAEGTITVASGDFSHAEGNNTTANGMYSHTEGDTTIANGVGSHAEGLLTIANGDYQHVQGTYNITSSVASAFILGNGTDNANRSNLIFAAGNQVQITGSLNTSGSVFFPTLVTSSTAVSNVVMYGTNGQLFITASSAIGGGGGISGDYVTTASFNAYTGSNISQFAGTASFAQTASYVPTLKASSASVASFTGQPYSASVTFATAYPNNLYAVSVIGEDLRAWSISGKSPSGFTIDSNSSIPLTNPVYWIATPFNS